MLNFAKKRIVGVLNEDQRGMTLLELLVSSSISLSVMGMMITMLMSNRQAYTSDLARTRLHQNIRSAFDVINSEVRQAGERLPFNFPAIMVVNGASGAPDELVLRRNLLDQTLILCQSLTTTSTDGLFQLTSSTAGLPPACNYGMQTNAYNSWGAFRTASGGTFRAYVYDMGTRLGEFFVFDSAGDSGSTQYVHNQSAHWSNNYTLGTSSAYAISEWRIKLSSVAGQTDLLQIIENGDNANPKNLVYGVENIQFSILMNDGTTRDTFSVGDNWGQIQAIGVTISGRDTYDNGRKAVTATLRTELFPRNVLSN